MYAILNDVYKAKTPPEEDILIEELVVVLEERGVGHGGETLPQGSQPPGETYNNNMNDKTNVMISVHILPRVRPCRDYL